MARERIGPRPPKPEEPAEADDDTAPKRERGGYRPWAELLRRTFGVPRHTSSRCDPASLTYALKPP